VFLVMAILTLSSCVGQMSVSIDHCGTHDMIVMGVNKNFDKRSLRHSK